MAERAEASTAGRDRKRRASRALLWMGLGAAITVAGLAAGATLALGALERRPELTARWLGDQLGRPVRLRALELGWQGGGPVVRLHGLQIAGEARAAQGLSLEAAEVQLDALGSLARGRLVPDSVTVRGARLRLARDPARGGVLVGGLTGGYEQPAGELLSKTLAAIPSGTSLSLRDASVSVAGVMDDSARGSALRLAPVSLKLQSDARGTRRLSGSVGVPGAEANPVRFSLRWVDGAAPARAIDAAEVTLSARELPLERVPWASQLIGVDALDGRLTLELEAQLEDGALRAARGTLALEAIALALRSSANPVRVPRAEALLDFSQAGASWRLSLLQLNVTGPKRRWPTTALRISGATGRYATPRSVALGQAPVAGLLPLLEAFERGSGLDRALRAALRPQGRIEQLELALLDGPDGPTLDRLELTVRDAAIAPAASRAHVDGVDLNLELTPDGGRAEVLDSRVRLTQAAPGRRPLNATGSLRWSEKDGVTVLRTGDLRVADGTLSARIEGALEWTSDAPGVTTDLELRADPLTVASFGQYMHAAVAAPKVTGWIGRAFRGGRVRELRAGLRGTLGSARDLYRALSLHARFGDVTLRYAPGWPELSGLDGEVSLAAGRLGFEVHGGDVVSASIRAASGQIEDVTAEDPLLRVSGQVDGAVENGARYLTSSPLRNRFAGLLENLRADGPAVLRLRLAIPLDKRPIDVDGELALRNTRVAVPALRSALEEVSGLLAFDRGGVRRGELNARYLDAPIAAVIEGEGAAGGQTRLEIRGETDPDGLIHHLYDVGALDTRDPAKLPLLARMSGRASWLVALGIPTHAERDQPLSLLVRSSLEGMALDLPAPLGKTRDEARALAVRTQIAPIGARAFRIEYGDAARAVLEMQREQDQFRLARGRLQLGGGELRLPDERGLEVRGSVDRVSVDAWLTLIEQATGALGQRSSRVRGGPLAELRAVDVQAGHLEALGARFGPTRIEVGHVDQAWNVTVSGPAVQGTITVPEPVGEAPLVGRFEHLLVTPGTTRGARPDTALDPRRIPPFELSAKRFRFQDLELGIAKISVLRVAEGLRVERIYALGESFELQGTGQWLHAPGGDQSMLDLRAYGADFGRMLADFGYADSGVEGGAAEIVLGLNWTGSPFDFNLATTRGTLHFRAADGRLLDLEPGTTGRVFGLLSLTMLPRRLLRLDFSDLFAQGMRYALIEGSFNLDRGDAYTNNLTMDADAARVDVVGRVGLVAQDYDQVVTVTPKMSSSLPLAPLWLAEKFLKRKLIDRAFSYRYTITGTWDAPRIERIPVRGTRPETG